MELKNNLADFILILEIKIELQNSLNINHLIDRYQVPKIHQFTSGQNLMLMPKPLTKTFWNSWGYPKVWLIYLLMGQWGRTMVQHIY